MVIHLATDIRESIENVSTEDRRSIGFPSAGDELEVKWGGVLLAATAFALTRILVVEAVYAPTGRPPGASLARLLPLVLGLGLVAYGVSIAVSTHDRSFANRVTAWYLVGSAGMALVVGGSLLGAGHDFHAVYRSGVFAGAVIGGGIGGVLVGRYAALNRRQHRQLARQTDQAVLLNRLLRHEVLNALTAIRGHAGLLADGEGDERSRAAVESNSDRIEETIEDVGFLVRTMDEAAGQLEPVALDTVLGSCQKRFQDRDGDVRFTDETRSVTVRADEHLETVFGELVEAALVRGAEPTASVTVTADDTTARIYITAPGQWLDAAEREALVEALPAFDSPEIGYGMSISRLLVDLYGGTIDVQDGLLGTKVEIRLPRTAENAVRASDSPGVAGDALRNATVAGLGAGVAMGLVLQGFSGEMAIIGGLYSIPTFTVGWITHLFHSVVFAILYVAFVSWRGAPGPNSSLKDLLVVGIVYSIVLWVVAGGVVMGVWLNAVGIPSPIPNLGLPGLVGHLVWGLGLAVSFHVLSNGDILGHVFRSIEEISAER